MFKGGYQIINLENRPMALGVGQLFPGIYSLIEGTRKAILLSGLNLDEREMHDRFTEPFLEGTEWQCRVDSNYYITITDTDVVTLLEY